MVDAAFGTVKDGFTSLLSKAVRRCRTMRRGRARMHYIRSGLLLGCAGALTVAGGGWTMHALSATFLPWPSRVITLSRFKENQSE